MDADDTYPVESAKNIIAPILNGESDMVVGTRANRERGAMSALHVVGNRIITGTINLCFGMRFKDVLSGYRALSKEVAKDLYLASAGFEVETE